MGEMDVLPRWERLVYWIVGIGGMLYVYYSFYMECLEKNDLIRTRPGIKLLGGRRDAPDTGWNYLCRLIPNLLPILAGHVFVGQFLHSLRIEIWLQKSLRLLYDILGITYIVGVRAVLLYSVECVAMYLVTLQRHTFVVWMVGLLFTTTISVDCMRFAQFRLVNCSGLQTVAFSISLSLVHIRLISSCIEIVKNRNADEKSSQIEGSALEQSRDDQKSGGCPDFYSDSKQKQCTKSKQFINISIIDYLTYIFYLPIFFTGPILIFDKFMTQFSIFYHSCNRSFDPKEIVKKIVKLVLVASFIEFQSHFMFISSVQALPEIIRKMSVSAVVGLTIWQAQFFHLKYLCTYGISSVFYTIDGQTPIPLPACTSWVYSFSDIWKYFDVGLYNFIKTYIYIPCGGSKAGFQRQILGTVLAFFFMCFWHGSDASILVWCSGNLIFILLEIAASRLEYSMFGSKWKYVLGAPNVLRLRGLGATPLYVASGVTVMFFFFSMSAGKAIADKMIFDASWKTLLLEYGGFYCAIQNAMVARKWVVGKRSK